MTTIVRRLFSTIIRVFSFLIARRIVSQLMKLEEAFGLVLKKIRLEEGMSQEKLALHTGLDRTFISMLERGKRSPSLRTIFLLSAYLSITPSDFIQQTMEAIDENSQ